jgi:cellulose synthase/poly-beta-1,6-N-acetylglucosamine synthase-like glycosyltransferase
MMTGVSFVVPVHNGAALIRDTLASILAQADGRPMEIIVIDDHSNDGSLDLLRELAAEWPLRLVAAESRGAAAAINTGVRAARYPIICQVDQDVVLHSEWMSRLTAEFDDPAIAAAQGHYTSVAHASWCARAMSLDLEYRYAAIEGKDTDHVCTGNSAYRGEALQRIGLFDEALGYGYDNDVSYRLRDAGYRLAFCREARSSHRWRDGLLGYLQQQYGFGYGRLDLVAKHPRHVNGDKVSPAAMMAHPVLMALAIASGMLALFLAAVGAPWTGAAWTAGVVVAGLAIERFAAGVAATVRYGTPVPLGFPLLHLCRDVSWVVAMAVWLARRVAGRPSRPVHSMRSRPAGYSANVPRPLRPAK